MTATLDHLAALLTSGARLRSAPGGKVVIVLPSGKEVVRDREALKEALRNLASRERENLKQRASQAVHERDKVTARLSFDVSHPGATQFESLDDLQEHEQAEALALTFNADEAARVADLAESAGCRQTAALLRLLCDRCRLLGSPEEGHSVRVEDLLDASEDLELAWHRILVDEAEEGRLALWERLLQTLGGMEKGLHAPALFAAVVDALQRDPQLTLQVFWDRFAEDDSEARIYRSTNAKGRELLKHEADSDRGVTLSSLKRYFTEARKGLQRKS
ncbi:MAG TPA: hypothetical protein VF017_04695 [Thermoanaerobaculia bacterium]|nr:hypothetical protein [Thermoanaerobaculia bacterium]